MQSFCCIHLAFNVQAVDMPLGYSRYPYNILLKAGLNKTTILSKNITHILKSNLEATKQEHLIVRLETVSVFPAELHFSHRV